MRKEFKALFKTMEEIKTKIAELEQEEQERAELRQKTKTELHAIVKKYYEAEQKLNESIEQSEKENQKNREEIKELMRKQMQAENTGEHSGETERLQRLKTEVTTYPLKVEAMEQLRKDIVISAADQQRVGELRERERAAGARVRTIKETITMLLGQLKGDDCFNCLASFEYVPGRDNFMVEEFKKFENMRKEEIKWEF